MKLILKSFVLFFLVLFFSSVFGQSIENLKTYPRQNHPIFRINMSAPIGVHFFASAEFNITKKITLLPKAGIVSALGFRKESTAPELSNISTAGFYSIELRRYINLISRFKRNRNINQNSGDYLGVKYFSSGPPFSKSNQFINFESTNSVQLEYGMQRSIGQHFYWGSFIGFVVQDEFKSNVKNSPVGGFPLLQFGFNLGYTF